MATDVGTTELPLALRLLDHQIDGPDGAALTKVDDIEITVTPGGLTATALLCGPGALGERLPGRLGQWTLASWRRLSLEPYPRPIRIPLIEVRRIGSAIVVTEEAARAVQQRLTWERWLYEHLIKRLPGSGAVSHPEPGSRQRGTAELDTQEHDVAVIRLSNLLGFEVHGQAGHSLGTVHEVIAQRPSTDQPALGPVPVIGYIVGPQHTGSTFGYDRHPEHGPWLLRAGVLALHRRDVQVSAHHVTELDIAQRTLVADQTSPLHSRGTRASS
jgi:sporulation protein YlmC with PRC-barrel domain